MTAAALLFMALAWTFVIGLVAWSWSRLLKGPPDQPAPPPGTAL